MKRPALRYFGGKWRLGPWIISHFPDHYCYVEPYGGGGSVLLQKRPSVLEVYNDINGEVVNFFRQLRENTDELVRAISLTPFSREEYNQSFEETEDPLESARRLYIRSFQSYGSHTDRKSGWRWENNKKSNKTAIGSWNNPLAHLQAAAARLRQVQIEHDDAFRVLKRYDTPDTLFYLDPPYIETVLKSQHRYKNSLTEKDHKKLLATITTDLEGMVIISMMPHQIYQEALTHWNYDEKETRTQNGNIVTESLWLSPNIVKRKKQIRLF
jgi:DNA adenine methylase